MHKLVIAALTIAMVPLFGSQGQAAPVTDGIRTPDNSVIERRGRGADDARPRRDDRRQDRTTVGR